MATHLEDAQRLSNAPYQLGSLIRPLWPPQTWQVARTGIHPRFLLTSQKFSVHSRRTISFSRRCYRLPPLLVAAPRADVPILREATIMSSQQTGLTGRAALLSEDDAAAYEALVARLAAKFNPIGDEEHALVQSIADSEWRLARIPALEEGIYAVGRLEFAALFSCEEDEAAVLSEPKTQATVRRQLLDAKVFLAYQRPLNNLCIQEARLRRQREKDSKTLRELQEARSHPVAAPGFDFAKPATPPLSPAIGDPVATPRPVRSSATFVNGASESGSPESPSAYGRSS